MAKPTIEKDGWVSTRTADGVAVHLRVALNAARQLVVTDVFVSAPDVTTDVLRSIRPGRIVAAVQSEEILRGGEPSGVNIDLARLVALTGLDDSDLTLGELRPRATSRIKSARRPQLGRPDGTNPDAFYRRVANAYRSAATESPHAAKLLADENSVPLETVRRWVKEARRRGFLPPGRKGQAG